MNVFIAIDIVIGLLLCAYVAFGILITSGVMWAILRIWAA